MPDIARSRQDQTYSPVGRLQDPRQMLGRISPLGLVADERVSHVDPPIPNRCATKLLGVIEALRRALNRPLPVRDSANRGSAPQACTLQRRLAAIDAPQSRDHLRCGRKRRGRRGMNGFWQFCSASTTALLLLGSLQSASAAAASATGDALSSRGSTGRTAEDRRLSRRHPHHDRALPAGHRQWRRRDRLCLVVAPRQDALPVRSAQPSCCCSPDAFYMYSWDPDLKQMNKVGLKSTLGLVFCFASRSVLPNGVAVTRFEHSGNTVRVSVVESAEPDAGSLTMVFSDSPLALRQWTVVDQQGRVTNVSLSETQYGMVLDPKLFRSIRIPIADKK